MYLEVETPLTNSKPVFAAVLLAFSVMSPTCTTNLTPWASGSVRPADPERVVLKRAVITGYPHKIHKRKAVIRFMFHCPEDVRWFRPLELWTKYGRHGRIREPLGTHGSLKAAFDGVLQQRDTVCASLYKRVFPKFPAPGP